MIIQRVSVIGFLCFFILFHCSSSEDDNSTGPEQGHPPAEMIDTWIYRMVTVDSVPASLSNVMDWVPDAVEARFHIVNDIGSYVYEEVNLAGGQLFAESGFVYIEDNRIDINKLQDGQGNPLDETIFLTFELVEDTLTLRELDEGTELIFTLHRN